MFKHTRKYIPVCVTLPVQEVPVPEYCGYMSDSSRLMGGSCIQDVYLYQTH